MKVLCVLYDDPKTGMPEKYARDDLPKIDKYPDGMTLPSPKALILLQENCLDVFQEN
jgi:formate dehydrogenase